jgi:exodeoxyribonuclease V gamma subunit
VGGTVVELVAPALRRAADGTLLRLTWSAGTMMAMKNRKPEIRLDKLARYWPAHLLAQAAGEPVRSVILAPGGSVGLKPLERDAAVAYLAALVDACQANLTQPLPIGPKTAVAYVEAEQKAEGSGFKAARGAYEPNAFRQTPGEQEDPHNARVYPSFESLVDAGFEQWTALYAPVAQYAEEL